MLKTPVYSEGFGGVARGSGHPDCLRTLPESSQLLDVFTSVSKSTDYAELQLLLSKMACLKKDLMSPSGIIEATRYQTFDTNHDRIAVAELTGLCLSQNIPSRDLDIIFTTWRDRSQQLVRRLSTTAGLSEQDTVKAEKLYSACWSEVYSVSQSKCLKTNLPVQNDGDVAGYEPTKLTNIQTYEYKYGGKSASGWNGAV